MQARSLLSFNQSPQGGVKKHEISIKKDELGSIKADYVGKSASHSDEQRQPREQYTVIYAHADCASSPRPGGRPFFSWMGGVGEDGFVSYWWKSWIDSFL